MEKTKITVIGAGVIGLAVSYLLSEKKRDITVIEKNPSFGQETSSRNSEVIHAGIYYPKESLKAKTCVKGRILLYELCSKHNIPCKKLGKLIVAPRKEEIPKLNAIYKNALACGVNAVRFLSKEEACKMEPSVKAASFLFSAESGIVDTHKLMNFFFAASKERGVNFAFSTEAKKIEKQNSLYGITVREPGGEDFSFGTEIVINSAGLSGDTVASFAGMDPDKYSYRIHYCKGQYFRIRNPEKFSIKHLVYPPPPGENFTVDMLRRTCPPPEAAGLGIHVTPDLAGGLRLGPDARYVKDLDYGVREEDKAEFLDSAKEFLPSMRLDDIIPDTAGIRPKLEKPGDGFRDFIISDEEEKGFPKFINLIGIESPGLTSCLAIAEMVRDIIEKLEF